MKKSDSPGWGGLGGRPWPPLEGKPERGEGDAAVDAVGLEAEFRLLLDDEPADPARVFKKPTAFLGPDAHHRVGTSYHLPTGGAVYFDSGVIEIVSPLIEVDPGAVTRTVRALWEGIAHTRDRIGSWEAANDRTVRLVGFSTHYNVSVRVRPVTAERNLDALAAVLIHVLPMPVLFLAGNRASTGVGIRPRPDRMEVTVDFTPAPMLTAAAALVAITVIREVAAWPVYDVARLDELGLPRLRGFEPVPHTSRKGLLARQECFAIDPFRTDPDEPVHELVDGERISTRTFARRVVDHFADAIRELADPLTLRLLEDVLAGRVRSLMELPDRPADYEDVGAPRAWDDAFSEDHLPRSRFERIQLHVLSRTPFTARGHRYTPVGMDGWTRVAFRREDGRRVSLSLRYLASRLTDWDEG